MASLYETAEYVAALCCVSMGQDYSFRDAGGVIDRALEDTCKLHPETIQRGLSFSTTSVGRRCLEWPEISRRMVEGGLVTCAGPSFTHLTVCITMQQAEVIMARYFRAQQYRALASQFNRFVLSQ